MAGSVESSLVSAIEVTETLSVRGVSEVFSLSSAEFSWLRAGEAQIKSVRIAVPQPSPYRFLLMVFSVPPFRGSREEMSRDPRIDMLAATWEVQREGHFCE